MNNGLKLKIPYFITVVCCFVIMSVTMTAAYNCWGVFTIPICNSTGISRSDFSIFFTAILFGQCIGATIADKIISRLGMIKCIAICIVGQGISELLITMVKNTPELCLLGFLLGLMLMGTSFLPLSIIICNWFVKYRGLVMGFVFMGSALLSAIILPIVSREIEIYDWKYVLVSMALIMILITLPFCCMFLKESPEDRGLAPLSEGGLPEQEVEERTGRPLKETIKSRKLWLFAVFIAGLYATITLSETFVPYLMDEGFDGRKAAFIQAMEMAVLAISRVLSGLLCDKFGIKTINFIVALLTTLEIIGLIACRNIQGTAFLISIGAGVGEAGATVIFPLFTRELFGRKYYSQIYGFLTAIVSIVSAITPLFYGRIYGVYRSYIVAYICIGIVYLLGIFCLTLVCRDCRGRSTQR